MRTVKMPKFSSRLKELRKEKHLKQVEMAEILECTKTHYQQIEYGHVNIPSLTLGRLPIFSTSLPTTSWAVPTTAGPCKRSSPNSTSCSVDRSNQV